MLSVDVDAVSIYPHAHYLGKEMRGTATLPDGSQQDLLWIRQWDLRWQDRYRYRLPVFLPRGTRLSMRFTYDNSAGIRTTVPIRRSACDRTALDRRDGPSLDRGRAAPRGGRGAPQRRFRPPLSARRHRVGRAGRPARSAVAAAHNMLATRYLQVGRVADAQAQLEEALRLDPRDAEAHSNLGLVLQAQGRLNEGMEHLRTARAAEAEGRLRALHPWGRSARGGAA